MPYNLVADSFQTKKLCSRQNVGLGLGLDHILVIVKLLRTVAHVMAVKYPNYPLPCDNTDTKYIAQHYWHCLLLQLQWNV